MNGQYAGHYFWSNQWLPFLSYMCFIKEKKKAKKDSSNPKTKNISYENNLENYVHK